MVGVIGLGFVGLTTALGFAHKGLKVFGFDISAERLETLRQRQVPFYEPVLAETLNNTLGVNFFLSPSLSHLINQSRVIFYCVGTPRDSKGEADLDGLLKALGESLTIMQNNPDTEVKVLVIKSTVPPGTTKQVVKGLIKQQGLTVGQEIGLACNPEFLREGYAWDDFIHPDRIVIGAEDHDSKVIMQGLFQPFDAPIHFTSYNGAEFIKYLSNAMLATMISFANEMSMVAHHIGDVDIKEAFQILHQDKRWTGTPAPMRTYVFPGCGFGGYCLPKDLDALYWQAGQRGYEAKLLKSVAQVNDLIRRFVVERITAKVSPQTPIGILGLSFKPNSDDVRESSAKYIIELLLARGYANIVAHDPMAIDNFKKEYHFPIKYADDLKALLDSAECCVLLTAWDEYINNKSHLQNKILFDFRYCL